ncbi:MAG: MarR family winged helix-turn-helix transcriptional regulator [Microbacterium sp.]
MTRNPGSMPALTRALQRYVDARSAALQTARRELQVNELDARAVLFIADNPGARPGQLREYLGITSAGVTTLVDRLVERGAVRRDVDESDRRVNHLTLTIDLAVDPWSALTRFDDAFSAATVGADPSETERFAAALDALTASATSALR